MDCTWNPDSATSLMRNRPPLGPCPGPYGGSRERGLLYERGAFVRSRRVDVTLLGKENSNSHGARQVNPSITMIKSVRTSRLSIKNSLCVGLIESILSGFRTCRTVVTSRLDSSLLHSSSVLLSSLELSDKNVYEPWKLALDSNPAIAGHRTLPWKGPVGLCREWFTGMRVI